MPSERFDSGLAVRREVLGHKYVEQALANADAWTEPLQQLVTEYCWGEIWTRDGLDRPVRSLLNIVMMVALNRPHELAVHVRGGLRNGCSREEIVEALLQATVYAGVPAGIDAFRVATGIFAEEETAEQP